MAKMIETKAAMGSREITDDVTIAFLAGNQNQIILDSGKEVPHFRDSIQASLEKKYESRVNARKYWEALNAGEKQELREVLKPVIEKSAEKKKQQRDLVKVAKSGMFMFRK